MAKKRKDDDIMPASPLAAKLGQQLNPNKRRGQPTEQVPQSSPPPFAGESTAATTEPPQEAETTPKPLATPPIDRRDNASQRARRTIKRKETRVMLEAAEVSIKDDVLAALQTATGRQIEYSHLMRSLLSLAGAALPSIESNAKHAALRERPSNSDHLALAEFEEELANFLLLAFRDKKAMDNE